MIITHKKHQCSPKWKENSKCYEQRQDIPDNIFSCNAVGIDFYLKKIHLHYVLIDTGMYNYFWYICTPHNVMYILYL